MRCASWHLKALEDVNSAAATVASERGNLTNADFLCFVGVRGSALGDAPVSYTHLTLPTKA